MRRRRVIVGLVTLAIVFVAVLLWPRGPRPCLASFERVRGGMTIGDVCATVGAPPTRNTGMSSPERSITVATWDAADGRLLVVFDCHDRAIDVATTRHSSVWARLRARLGL